MLRAFADFIKQHKTAYLFGGILAILSGLFGIFPNYIIQLFVDSLLSKSLNGQLLAKYLGVYIGISLLTYVITAIWLIILFSRSSMFTRNIRQEMFKKLSQLRLPFYERYQSGDLITRMTSDIDGLGETLAWGFLILVSDGTWLISLISVMSITISWQVTFISIIPIIMFGIVVYFIGDEAESRYDKHRDAVALLSNEVLEVVEGVRVMRAYGKRELEQERFNSKTSEVMEKTNKMNNIYGLFEPVANIFTGLSLAIGLALGAFLVKDAKMTIGQLITFQIYLSMLTETVWGMSDLVAIYQQGQVLYRKISEVKESRDEVQLDGNEKIKKIDSIEFKEYEFSYPDSTKPAIKKINFVLKSGETLGIVGKTGAGKSTLVRQLLRQYPAPKNCSILVNNKPIESLSAGQLADLIGYVPQDHVLFSRTVRENILFGKSQAKDKDLWDSIKAADFEKDIENMSDGLETLIGEKGVAISGGQKQRVAIARAMIRKPELLILDDSLSAVDAKTERAIIENIQELRDGKTNIIITHRLSAVAHADKVLVLEDGQIVEQGSPGQLLNSQGWYYQQYTSQQMEEEKNENI